MTYKIKTDNKIIGIKFVIKILFYLVEIACLSKEKVWNLLLSIFILLLSQQKEITVTHSLYEAASECVCAALYSVEDINRHRDLVTQLYNGVHQLQPTFQSAMSHEETEKLFLSYLFIFISYYFIYDYNVDLFY